MGDRTRTLLLLRHAKSDYPDGVSDHRRPLAPRGVREAALAGDWIRATTAGVDAVLCSTATRTRQTLARTGIDAPAQFLDSIYDSTPGIVLAEINGVAARFETGPDTDTDTDTDTDIVTLAVVGHEPVMSSLALGLADNQSADSAVAAEIATKFPTSAVAVLRWTGRWDELELGAAQTVDFHIAR